MKTQYAVLAQGVRTRPGNTDIYNTVVFWMANSRAEATVLANPLLAEQCPEYDGWRHNIAAYEVPSVENTAN